MDSLYQTIDDCVAVILDSGETVTNDLLGRIDALLALENHTITPGELRQRVISVFLSCEIVRRRFYDFAPPLGLRQGMDEPQDVAMSLEEQFARLRLVRNKLIEARPITFDDCAVAYIEDPAGPTNGMPEQLCKESLS